MNGLNISNGVLVGSENELYLAQGNHNPIDYILGGKKVSIKSIGNFWDNIKSRQRFCKVNDVKYRHIVFPDKHVVNSRCFPLGEVDGLFGAYTSECESDEAASAIVYPLKDLRSHPKSMFYRDDTHMNPLGNTISLFCILGSLFPGKDFSFLEEDFEKILIDKKSLGDLSSKLGKPERVVKAHNNPPGVKVYRNFVKGGNNGIVDIFMNPNALYESRVLIYGDSFFRGLLPILSICFSDILFLRTPFFHREMFYLYRPNFTLTGNVERYLSTVNSDSTANPFFMYQCGKEDINSEQGAEFISKYKSVLCGSGRN